MASFGMFICATSTSNWPVTFQRFARPVKGWQIPSYCDRSVWCRMWSQKHHSWKPVCRKNKKVFSPLATCLSWVSYNNQERSKTDPQNTVPALRHSPPGRRNGWMNFFLMPWKSWHESIGTITHCVAFSYFALSGWGPCGEFRIQ